MSKRAPQSKQPGLEGRHRNDDGRTRAKNGATTVKELRETYGSGVAPGSRSDMKLDTLLERTGFTSLTAYIEAGKPPVQ